MEHVRIDEGIKRRQRKSTPIRRSAETGMLEAIPADLDVHAVLQRYLNAPTASMVARELGVRRSSLTHWLRKTVPAEWRAVQLVRAEMRKEDGDDGIYGSRTAFELARARELLRSGQFDLERLDPANWGQKQEITTNLQPVINIAVVVQRTDSPLPEATNLLITNQNPDGIGKK